MHKLLSSSLIALSAFTLAGPLRARQSDSVVEAARKSSEQKQLATKPAHVYTNQNIPTAGAISVVGPAAAPAPGAIAPGVTSRAGEGSQPANRSKAEAEWRGRFAALRTRLRQARTDLALLQRELGDLRVQYYPSPQQAMREGYTQSDLLKKQTDIDAKQKEVADLQQQESDLENEMRKADGDPGWAREP
jgi:hypothetical protein